MDKRHFNFFFFLLLLFSFIASSYTWEGKLIFSEEFDGDNLRKHYWTYEEGCEGKGYRDVNLECFKRGTNNVFVENGTLIITARPEVSKEYMMGAYKQRKMHYSSGKILQSGFVSSYGTYIVKARLPRGKHLLPSIYLQPVGGQIEQDCKYEEIDILQARGQRPSTISVGAHHGRSYVSTISKTLEKVFRNVDFSKDFHEFGIKWMPTRIEWFVDRKKIYEVSTHYASDWISKPGSNFQSCSTLDRKPFSGKSMLFVSLAVGGHMFPETKYGTLEIDEATAWEKPTFEIDYIKIYDPKKGYKLAKEKLTVFNIPGIDGLDLIY